MNKKNQDENEDYWYGVVDENGNTVIPIKHEVIGPLGNGLFKVYSFSERDYKVGIMNAKNKLIVPIEYDYMGEAFQNGLLHVYKDERGGLMNTKGEIIVPLEYNGIWDYGNGENGLYRVSIRTGYEIEDRNVGLINAKNEILIPIEYNWVMHAASEGDTDYFWVENDGLWGIYSISTAGANESTVTEDNDPDRNPPAGITLAIIPTLIAGGSALLTKKRRLL